MSGALDPWRERGGADRFKSSADVPAAPRRLPLISAKALTLAKQSPWCRFLLRPLPLCGLLRRHSLGCRWRLCFPCCPCDLLLRYHLRCRCCRCFRCFPYFPYFQCFRYHPCYRWHPWRLLRRPGRGR